MPLAAVLRLAQEALDGAQGWVALGAVLRLAQEALDGAQGGAALVAQEAQGEALDTSELPLAPAWSFDFGVKVPDVPELAPRCQ